MTQKGWCPHCQITTYEPPTSGWFAEAGVDWRQWALGFSLDVGRAGVSAHVWVGPLWACAGIEVEL